MRPITAGPSVLPARNFLNAALVYLTGIRFASPDQVALGEGMQVGHADADDPLLKPHGGQLAVADQPVDDARRNGQRLRSLALRHQHAIGRQAGGRW